MKHYISICTERGPWSKSAMKVDLVEAMGALCLPQYASPTKEGSWLIFNGYSSQSDKYERNEGNVNKFSTIFIDCDNPRCDRDIILKWKKFMEGYDYLLYETYSSTPERPKFRAIVPLDAELDWNHNAKTAIFHKFRQFADEKASWFFSPTRNKLNTVYDSNGAREFPASILKKDIEELARLEKVEETNRILKRLHADRKPQKFKFNVDGWRNLPSVKKCLSGLSVGERDNSLCCACYAMAKNGYKSSIHQFLDECDVPLDLKQKWKLRYR